MRPRRASWPAWAVSASCLLCAVNARAHGAAPTGSPDYRVEAAFLVNFARFIEWPGAVAGDTSPFVIGVVGDDPFGRALDEAVKGKTAQDRPMVVRRLDWRDDINRLPMAFISASEHRHLPEILRRSDTASVVTVSDLAGFCRLGGVIALVAAGDRMRFEINVPAAHRKNLRISSRLLSLAISRKGGP